MQGSVTVWFIDRDFGFVKADEDGIDYFMGGRAVRSSNVGTPKVGDRLSFDLEEGKDGRPRATNLARTASRLVDAEAAFKPAPSAGPVRFGVTR